MRTTIEISVESFIKQNAISIDYKLDYMARLFRKISHKRFECYVIQRLWHLLNDDRIKFVVQQYVRREKEDMYALADLYLPQLGIIVEVNEAFHYASERKTDIDATRNAEVAKITGAIVAVVDCTQPLSCIHAQIDDIIKIIRQKIKEQESKGCFKTWGGLDSMTIDYYKKKGYVRVEDDDYFKTIDDICDVFDTKVRHLGYLRAGGAEIPGTKEYYLWFPSVINSSKWHNELINGKEMVEFNDDIIKKKKHFDSIISEYNNKTLPKRITFYREKDDLGFSFYRFVGVFELDYKKSVNEGVIVWKMVSDKYNI